MIIHKVYVQLDNGMRTTVESHVRTSAWVKAMRFIMEHGDTVASITRYEITAGGEENEGTKGTTEL